MGILSTHTDVWKCEIVKIPLTPRPFSLFQLKIAFSSIFLPKSTLTICIFEFFFVLLHKIWHVPFGSQKGTSHVEGHEDIYTRRQREQEIRSGDYGSPTESRASGDIK